MALIWGISCVTFGLHQDIGGGKPLVGNILNGPAIGGIEGGHAEEAAGGDLGNADDNAPVVIQFKRSPEGKIPQFR